MAATCEYNGIAFTTLYRSRISSRPIHDQAGRTVVYVEHTLTVDGYIAITDETTDETMEDIRRLLTAQGGFLNYQDAGFGELVVNQVGSVRDVKWGPVPEVLEWVPLGGDGMACKITWRCVARIPECDNARYENSILALNYTVTHTIDRDNFLSESLQGYLEIPMTRRFQGDRVPPDSVDDYRERLEARQPPAGWRRLDRRFVISADRRRLDFSWTDQQTDGNALPLLVTSIDASHTVQSAEGLYFKKWQVTLEATITMTAGAPRALALDVFLLLAAERLVEAHARKGGSFLLGSFMARESIYGRPRRSA